MELANWSLCKLVKSKKAEMFFFLRLEMLTARLIVRNVAGPFGIVSNHSDAGRYLRGLQYLTRIRMKS